MPSSCAGCCSIYPPLRVVGRVRDVEGGLSKRWIGEEKMALRAIARLKQLFPKRCPQPRRPATVVVADDRLHVAAHRGGPRYRRLRRGELPARERVRHACENATAAVARHTDASDTRSFWYRRWAGVMGGAGEPEKAPQEPKPSIPGENIVGDTQLTRVSGVPVTTLSLGRYTRPIYNKLSRDMGTDSSTKARSVR